MSKKLATLDGKGSRTAEAKTSVFPLLINYCAWSDAFEIQMSPVFCLLYFLWHYICLKKFEVGVFFFFLSCWRRLEDGQFYNLTIIISCEDKAVLMRVPNSFFGISSWMWHFALSNFSFFSYLANILEKVILCDSYNVT